MQNDYINDFIYFSKKNINWKLKILFIPTIPKNFISHRPFGNIDRFKSVNTLYEFWDFQEYLQDHHIFGIAHEKITLYIGNCNNMTMKKCIKSYIDIAGYNKIYYRLDE